MNNTTSSIPTSSISIEQVFDLHPLSSALEVSHHFIEVAGDATSLTSAQYAEVSARLSVAAVGRTVRGPIGTHHRSVG